MDSERTSISRGPRPLSPAPAPLACTLICKEPGKVERCHQTMADSWAYARCRQSEQERRYALKAWLHHYKHHWPPLPAPISRPSHD